ncbi:hypothetical protein BGZ98_010278 [Dissophora globulifera]|nr:hypothetical protein BGZ98_010278 [Dissophora globulifera]
MAFLISLKNATRTFCSSPQRVLVSASAHSPAFARSNACLARTTTNTLTARYNLDKAFSQHQHSGFTFNSLTSLPSSPAAAAAKTGVSIFQRQSIRAFSQRANLFTGHTTIRSLLSRSRVLQQQQIRYYAQYPVAKRRPIRFFFKVMTIGAALVALPAMFVFGPGAIGIVLVPIAIGSIFGGMLLLTGGMIFLVFPVIAIGGALTFWLYAMPAAATAKDLKKILKRAQQSVNGGSSALSALGLDWEIERARPDEWFRWEFPLKPNEQDRISIRMAVFDPNDHSARKQQTMRWLDNVKKFGDDDSKSQEVEKKNGDVDRRTKRTSSGNFQIMNNSKNMSIENLSIERDNDHVLIRIEDDGAKLLNQAWGKNYLELAKIVDRAASELEAADSGLDLGEQVVLVHKDKGESFWNKFSLVGDIALRVPFSRTWVHDVTDE